MKILLTGVGGPAGICFAKSLHDVQGVELIGANAEEEAVGKKFVNKFYLLPFANDPEFLDSLQQIIKTEKIDYLIPLVDEELPIISKNIQQLGCKVLVSPYETIRYTIDKEKIYEMLDKYLPKVFGKDKVTNFPIFAKPKIGRGGKGAQQITDVAQLTTIDADTYIFQELLVGPEVTVDTLFDFTGKLIVAVPRIRAIVEKGISITGKVFKDDALIAIIQDIAERMTFVGPINFQFMHNANGYKLLEINSRSSGGMGITINAGVDIPKLTYFLLRDGIVENTYKMKEGVFGNYEEIRERQKSKLVNTIQ